MPNFEMNVKRVNDKYYVNEIEVSKEEYLDAETVLDEYLAELNSKNSDDLNENEYISKYNPLGDFLAFPIFDEDTLHERIAALLESYKNDIL